MLTKKERETIDAYDLMGHEWSTSHNTPAFWGHLFSIFQLFLSGGTVLEVGCGGGRDADTLIKMGYAWTGTDISRSMLSEARKRHPLYPVYLYSVYNLGSVPGAPFDGFWASAVLLHVPKKRIEEALGSVQQVVRPGGIGCITVKEGDGFRPVPVPRKKVVRHFQFYNEGELEPILERCGFPVLYVGKFHRNAGDPVWLTYIVQRAP